MKIIFLVDNYKLYKNNYKYNRNENDNFEIMFLISNITINQNIILKMKRLYRL